jgi:hypothetical protein
MQCPNCGSIRVRRSLRNGLYEGLFLRLLFRAPFRCFDCGTRYFGSSLNLVFRTRKHHRTIAGYFGFRGGQIRKFRRAIVLIILFAALIMVASWLVTRLSEPGAPPP